MSQQDVPIVITGLGTVHPAGCGREATAAALAGEIDAPWVEIDRSAGYHRARGARLVGLARHDLSEWVARGLRRRASRPSQFALAAARMALAEAGIEPGEDAEDRPTAMVFSNAFGPSEYTERILAQIENPGPMAVSPNLFTESVANAPAAQVALACRATGANITITQREAGGPIALARAAREIARGRAGRVLVVTVDEVTPLLHAVLDRYGSLARGPERPRPFDRDRNGFLLAEGATALVVESAETAARRGARVLARVGAAASAFDPRAPAHAWGPDETILAPALERLLARLDEAPEAIVTGASGSVAGDRLEALVLRRALGDLPPLLAPKAVLGEFGGAQLAAAVLALEGAPFAAPPGFREVDPALGVAPHAGGTLDASSVLVEALATGGAASWLVLERGEDT